jgi:hypothetical protein
MAIIQTQCTSFKAELYAGVHDLTTDTLKMALYEASADLGAATTTYTATGEISGAGYTAGGVTLTGVSIGSSGGTAWVTFDNPSWTGASFTARGALIYNSSKANRAIAVLDFGADRTTTGTFTVTLPVASTTTALIRS